MMNIEDKQKIITMKQEHKEDGIVDGFSSDEDICHEEIILEERKKTQPEHAHREDVKFKIPPPQEIKKKTYSLHPDMATGWAPKSDLPVPIPMVFDNRRVDSIVKRLLQKKHDRIKLVYLGPRFENTFYAWHNSPFEFPYAHIKAPQNMKFSNRAFCGQHIDESQGLIFDSSFQCGNLDCAVRVEERQYDLYIRVDSNTRGHLQWFNFKVTNLQKLQKYRFNICNFQKNKSLYTRGQKPFILSSQRLEKEGKGWEQMGDSIRYQQKSGKSAKVLSNDYNSYYKLSFDYYTEYQNDQIQIAYCIPYPYTRLTQFIKTMEKQCASENFLTVNKLCTTLGGLEVPLIIIHDGEKKKKKDGESEEIDEWVVNKKCIVISCRAHPGQSNGSFMMEGFLKFICGNSKEAVNLRTDFIFKVVPMLNPDGVCLGNYRTGISGRDFNRQYRNPDKLIYPEVYSFKKLVTENKAIYKENLMMFLDFHGHSTKKNVFMYGPEFPIIQKNYYQCRIFPKIVGNQTPMFRYYSCSFRISEFKVTTARAVLLRKLMIPLSYTIEASNGAYYDQQKMKDVPFNESSWIEMGRKIGSSVAEYGELVVEVEKSRIQKMRQRRLKKDCKTRRTSNSTQKSKQNFICAQEELGMISGQSSKMKKLLSEIKKAEEERQLEKIEDDQISEGSSDGEGQKDDLSPQRLNFLYQIIKNKRTHVPERSRKSVDEHKNFKTAEGEEMQDQRNQADSLAASQLDSPQLRDQQVFKPTNNVRGYLLRSKNTPTYLTDMKKDKVAAKIINFSFVGYQKPSGSSDKRKNSVRSEIQYNGSYRDRDRVQQLIDLKTQTKLSNSKVLDLSDNTFRLTLGNKTMSKQSPDKKQSTFMNLSPRKMAGRVDELKYRRLLMEEYKI